MRLKEVGQDQILKISLHEAKVVGLNLVGNMEITRESVLSGLIFIGRAE